MNKGLNLEREVSEQSEEDYVFGAASSPRCIAIIPEKDRIKFLPAGEVQKGKGDFMDCATRGPINILETKFNFLYKNRLLSKEEMDWLERTGYVQDGRITFSDRYNAMLSDTDKSGNSMKAPLQSIHSDGLIPKAMLPASREMTFEQYHDKTKITPAMHAIGAQFLNRFPINYERVFNRDFGSIIQEDMLTVVGYAWPSINKDDEYPRSDRTANHLFIYFCSPSYFIFDNYEDKGNDFIKKLAADYDLYGYGYRLVISRNEVVAPRSIIDLMIEALVNGRPWEVFDIIKKKLGYG